MTLTSLIPFLDWPSIRLAIRDTPDVPEHEYSGIDRMLKACIKQWLEPDLTSVNLWTELEFDGDAHGFLDLVLELPGKKAKIIDWKTTEDVTRTNWLAKIKADIQTSIYLGPAARWLKETKGLDVVSMQYRCVDQGGKLRMIEITQDAWFEEDADGLLSAVATTYGHLLNTLGRGDRWPTNKPSACFFDSHTGPSCKFFDDCSGVSRRPTLINLDLLDDSAPNSKSAIKDFLKCPEYFRRTRLCGEKVRYGVEAAVGTATHAGLDAVYRDALRCMNSYNPKT